VERVVERVVQVPQCRTVPRGPLSFLSLFLFLFIFLFQGNQCPACVLCSVQIIPCFAVTKQQTLSSLDLLYEGCLTSVVFYD